MAGIRAKAAHQATRTRLDTVWRGFSQRRLNGALTPVEQSIRKESFTLINDNGGEEQISTALRVLAEVIASDAALAQLLQLRFRPFQP